jgi:hypothetical protein
VPIGRTEQARDNAADAAETNDGSTLALGIVGCWRHVQPRWISLQTTR